jgi:hypothetical protein
MEATVRSLEIDRVTAEAMEALRTHGAACLLLKGPVFARWLYRDGSPRPYVDTDVLVRPSDFPVAQRALRAIGFSPRLDDTDTPGWRQVAHHWVRAGDDANVDLHRTLVGVEASDQELWDAFSADTEPFVVSGSEVRTPGLPARAFHIALHAAQHGTRPGKPLDDLERGLSLIEPEVWASARSLAARLSATGAFATGLRLSPEGRRVAGELGLPDERSVETALLAGEPVPGALGWHYLLSARGIRARLRIVVRKIFPTPRFMRAWSPIARRGPAGLAAAYGLRLAWVAGRLVPGFLAWWRARRSSGPRA